MFIDDGVVRNFLREQVEVIHEMGKILCGIGSDGDDGLWACEGGRGNFLSLTHALSALAAFFLLSSY